VIGRAGRACDRNGVAAGEIGGGGRHCSEIEYGARADRAYIGHGCGDIEGEIACLLNGTSARSGWAASRRLVDGQCGVTILVVVTVVAGQCRGLPRQYL